MRRISRTTNVLITLGVAASAGLLLGQLAIAAPDPGLPRPLFLEENRGQAAPEVRFLSHDGNTTVALGENELEVTAGDRSFHIRPAGGSLGHPRAELPEAGVVHYLEGPKDVPTCARVVYPHVYPGVNLVCQGGLSFRWELAPGAELRQLGLTFEGCRPEVDRAGTLRVAGLTFPPPQGARYELRGPDTVGFAGHSTKVVEMPAPPSTSSMQVDSEGRTWLLGRDSVTLLEGGERVFTTHVGGELKALVPPCVVGQSADGRAQVVRLQSSGKSAVYHSQLGRGVALGLALDEDGNVYVTGSTADPQFATRRAFQPHLAKATDAFVAKLDREGALVYSTYLGGEGDDAGQCVAVDSLGNAYVGGTTASASFPTQSPLQVQLAVAGDGFVAKVSPTGSALGYATYLGGSGTDSVTAIAVDEQGAAFVVGTTESPDFPTSLGAYQTERPGGQDVFLTKLNPTGSGVMFSTYLGAPARQDQGKGLALGLNQVTVSATTFTSVFSSEGEFRY